MSVSARNLGLAEEGRLITKVTDGDSVRAEALLFIVLEVDRTASEGVLGELDERDEEKSMDKSRVWHLSDGRGRA